MGFLEKSLKILSALKNHSKALKNPWVLLFPVGTGTVDFDLYHHKMVVPLFGAAYAAPNKSTTILYKFSNTVILISPLFQLSISEVEFYHLNLYFS